MPKYKGIVIADIHVGAFKLDKMLDEYTSIFLKHLRNMESLDFLIIDGDFFDGKFYLGDSQSIIAYSMMRNLIDICREKNTVVRVVYGTESHECNQYDVMSVFKEYDKIRVIKYVEEEELLPGLNVLYLPEEHIVNKYEYYKDYFSEDKKYDYVFGHGIIREVMKEASVRAENAEVLNSKRKKVPVFTSAELERICKGEVYFGHYHMYSNINDKVFYVGSFSRWEFGQEKAKGFIELTVNPEKEKYKNEFIENTMAENFITISYGYDSEVFKSDEKLEEALDFIDSMVEKDAINHVRCLFNVPVDAKNPEGLINQIRERYKTKDKIKPEITHGYIEEKRKQQKVKVETENEKYNFSFDKSIPLEERSSRFISIEYGKEVPSDNIYMYMNKSISEILDFFLSKVNDEED